MSVANKSRLVLDSNRTNLHKGIVKPETRCSDIFFLLFPTPLLALKIWQLPLVTNSAVAEHMLGKSWPKY
jgi:hypothetical protein